MARLRRHARAEIELGDSCGSSRRLGGRRLDGARALRPAHRRGRRWRARRGRSARPAGWSTPDRADLLQLRRRPVSTSLGDRPAEGSSSISTRRLDHQRARDRQHLPLAAREPAGAAGGAGARGRGSSAYMASICRRACRARWAATAGQQQVLRDRHAGEDVLGLRHEGEAAGAIMSMGGQPRDVRAAEQHAARRMPARARRSP